MYDIRIHLTGKSARAQEMLCQRLERQKYTHDIKCVCSFCQLTFCERNRLLIDQVTYNRLVNSLSITGLLHVYYLSPIVSIKDQNAHEYQFGYRLNHWYYAIVSTN